MKIFNFFIFFFGLIQLSAQTNSLKNYTFKEGLTSNNLHTIEQDKIGYVWFSSDEKLNRFNGDKFDTFTLENQQITILKSKNDSLLIGTNKGLSILFQEKKSYFESKKVTSILPLKNNVFVGTTQGIFILKKDYLAPIKTNFQIDLNTINDIKFDGKNYWIATNKALWKLDKLIKPSSLKRIEKGYFTNILVLNKQIIASTKSTVFSIGNSEIASPVFSGLKTISKIIKIKNKYWIATQKNGITVLNQDFSFDRNINKYNTLATNNINTVFEDQQHNIWIATQDNGVYKFESTNKNIEKPIVHISKIDVVYENLDSVNLNNYQKVLQLPSHKNHISFSYQSININQPKKITYRYKLNTTFSPWSKKNNVDFANLTPGNYTFTTQSKINNIESKPVSFKFYIDTPLHQKNWFRLSLLGALILLLAAIIYTYIQKIKRKNKTNIEKLKLENHLLSLEQRALQLQMNPHFIFNVLNGIKALGSAGKKEELSSTISKFATLLRSVLLNSRQEEINLSEEIDTLKNYLELEQQMSTKSFKYNIQTPTNIDIEEILIPPMLLQPFVENAIKHGINTKENGIINITFTTKNSFLNCTIDDNGIGFEQSKKEKGKTNHQSVAVKVTQERIEALSKNSRFSIKELKEKEHITGTRVWFKIPLKTDY